MITEYGSRFSLTHDGAKLWWSRFGTEGGVPIVLCDGVGCDGFIWKFLAPHLAQRHRVGSDVGERDLRRLLHHVAELPGEGQPRAPRHGARFDEEDVSPSAGHGQACCHARGVGALGHIGLEPLPAQAGPTAVWAGAWIPASAPVRGARRPTQGR